MSWQTAYRSRLTTAEKAFSTIAPDARVYVSGNAATPRHLMNALSEHAGDFDPPVHLHHVLWFGGASHESVPGMRHRAWFVGPADRVAVREGSADYVPCNLSDIPELIRDMDPPLDVALLSVSPPDKHGFLSLGTEVLASLTAAYRSKRVVVQVNQRMPRVLGNAFVHVSDVDAIVEADEELPTIEASPPSDVECAIADHIVPLVKPGSTLQLGIGGIPDAVMARLANRTDLDLGVHSEMISDGVMRAVEGGVVTGRFKARHRRKVVTTFLLGSRDLYDWAHDNAVLEAHPCDHTNDFDVASSHKSLVAINSALSVDLSGQINSDSLGQRIYSGVGGQLDFIRAASRSKGGVPIIALPATAKGGTVSRIVPTLASGAGVVTPRADAHWVITEFGAVNLRGLSLRERAEALISIAHPRFRETLAAERGI